MLTTSLGAKGSFLFDSFWLYDWFLWGSGTFKNLVTANVNTVFTMCQVLSEDFTNSNSQKFDYTYPANFGYLFGLFHSIKSMFLPFFSF